MYAQKPKEKNVRGGSSVIQKRELSKKTGIIDNRLHVIQQLNLTKMKEKSNSKNCIQRMMWTYNNGTWHPDDPDTQNPVPTVAGVDWQRYDDGLDVEEPVQALIQEQDKTISVNRLGWTYNFVIPVATLDDLRNKGATQEDIDAIAWTTATGPGNWNIIKQLAGNNGQFELKVNGNSNQSMLHGGRYLVNHPGGQPREVTITFTVNSFSAHP